MSPESVKYVKKTFVRGYGDGAKTVTQYGVYEPARRKDGTSYHKYSIISKADYASLKASGVKFVSEKKKESESGYYSARTPEERIVERGIRVKADKKHGIRGKTPTLIREKELKYIAKIHGISPAVTSSIIQHADAVMVTDVETYQGHGKGYKRPPGTITYVSPAASMTRGAYYKHVLTPAQRTAIRKKEATLDEFINA